MEDFQQRVVDEKEELDGKIERLDAFANGDVFGTLPAEEQERMSRQLQIMRDYSSVLDERIAAFA